MTFHANNLLEPPFAGFLAMPLHTLISYATPVYNCGCWTCMYMYAFEPPPPPISGFLATPLCTPITHAILMYVYRLTNEGRVQQVPPPPPPRLPYCCARACHLNLWQGSYILLPYPPPPPPPPPPPKVGMPKQIDLQKLLIRTFPMNFH